MGTELEPNVKPLAYSIKSVSRESPSQKAPHILDTDLRNHWSTGTNNKEWILLELQEPCLLSHIRIHNKSVLEWEITVGLRHKPEAFTKVRPRCEAPRRDMFYPMNYVPCRYVRISCLRGNPIAIFFIELIGVPVPGLEPEFQPLVDHLLPQIISNKHVSHDLHLQLLQDITSRLRPFLPQLETDLCSFSDAPGSTRFLAMLAGPLYPILYVLKEREKSMTFSDLSESDGLKINQLPKLMVSSNFEPRRSRSPVLHPVSNAVAFRPDVVFMLLRKACKDLKLRNICTMAARVLQKLSMPEAIQPPSEALVDDEVANVHSQDIIQLTDYSSLFGEEFKTVMEGVDTFSFYPFDCVLVEEGILHVLYACSAQCFHFPEEQDFLSAFWFGLPLIQALLPALRPSIHIHDQIDDNFLHWKQPLVQDALLQIIKLPASPIHKPLLDACSPYLLSHFPSQVKAACVLLDLSTAILAPWTAMITAKADLSIELLEELLPLIQGAQSSIYRALAALKYILLAISGHMDDILKKYKDVKHKLLFLVEMLDSYLDPAMAMMKNRISFGAVPFLVAERQDDTFAMALNIIRAAVLKPAILPCLESEWRHGSVAPSALLAIFGPQLQLPPDIDACRSHDAKGKVAELSDEILESLTLHSDSREAKNDSDVKTDILDASSKSVFDEDAHLLFAPSELRTTKLGRSKSEGEGEVPVAPKNVADMNLISQGKFVNEESLNSSGLCDLVLDVGFVDEYFNLKADYLHLVNNRDSNAKALEFRRLALKLNSEHDVTQDSHDAAIDSLLLAAECHINPYFVMPFDHHLIQRTAAVANTKHGPLTDNFFSESKVFFKKSGKTNETVAQLESRRDKMVIQILLQAAELDREYYGHAPDKETLSYSRREMQESSEVSSLDTESADAVTLVRQNQILLCQFVVNRLSREQQYGHEILLQCLLFLLCSATEISCAPEAIVDIVLESAERLNALLTHIYYQLRDEKMHLTRENVCVVQRQWLLLQKLVLASSTDGDDDLGSMISSGSRHHRGCLVLPSFWIKRIPKFSTSPYPLVRFIGWMAVAHCSKQYLENTAFLGLDLSEVTCLLTIFLDELAYIDDIDHAQKNDQFLTQSSASRNVQEGVAVEKEHGYASQLQDEGTLHVLDPELHKFFPSMKRQFVTFSWTILEVVGFQLKSFPSSFLPDILSWFLGICQWKFAGLQEQKNFLSNRVHFKGQTAKNVKAVTLYLMETIISEHMEAMVAEVPRVIQVVVSLCQSSYSDVSFLDSILLCLKPLVSYALVKESGNEKYLIDDSGVGFESLCFNMLISNFQTGAECHGTDNELYYGALTVFALGVFFADFSMPRKRSMLNMMLTWVDFAVNAPASIIYDHLCAFNMVMKNCHYVVGKCLRELGVQIDFHLMPEDGIQCLGDLRNGSLLNSGTKDDLFSNGSKFLALNFEASKQFSSYEETIEFCKDMEKLIFTLYPSIELCWDLHHHLADRLSQVASKCILYSKCLLSICRQPESSGFSGSENELSCERHGNQYFVHWRYAFEESAKFATSLQKIHCWSGASVMLDYLFSLPSTFGLENMLSPVCAAIMHCCLYAPKISWRLQTDKWLVSLLSREFNDLESEAASSLVDLLSEMLAHAEPEQRSIAMKHLGKLVGQASFCGSEVSSIARSMQQNLAQGSLVKQLVASTWDRVAVLASSDPLMVLRAKALMLLSGYIPFAEHGRLQSFLIASDSLLPGLGRIASTMCEAPLTKISLTLLAAAFLYSPIDDILLVHESVWASLEVLRVSKGRLSDADRMACEALYQLKSKGEQGKEALKKVLSSSNSLKSVDPEFKSTRESILQVLSSLTSMQSYFDFFSWEADQEKAEVEEAEIELELINKEIDFEDASENMRDNLHKVPSSMVSKSTKASSRLKQLKADIQELEKTKLRQEIAARRQQKLMDRQFRQKFLEAAAIRELELLQEMDRARACEAEREIERQRLLEQERAKTRELRFNAEMEAERRTQKQLHRELEQRDGGQRSRRDISSSSTTLSRPRERYRDRESVRIVHEGDARVSHDGTSGVPPAASVDAIGIASSTSHAVSGSSSSFFGHKSEEQVYDDTIDGSRDSADTGSVGDVDSLSVDGLVPPHSSRQGSRNAKSRPADRKDRDGRREGKWERKH